MSPGISRPASAESPVDGESYAEPLTFRERRFVPWILALVDIAIVQLSLGLGFFVRHIAANWFTKSIGPETYEGMILGLLALPLANWLLGLYPGYRLDPVERLRRRTIGACVAFASLGMWDNLVLRGGWSRGIELSSLVFALVLSQLLEIAVISLLMHYGRWGTPVLVLSSDGAGSRLAESLVRRQALGMVPIGLLENRRETWGTVAGGVPVLGPVSLAPGYAAYARTAIVAMPNLPHAQLTTLVQSLPFPTVVLAPDLPGVQSLWVTPRDLGGTLGLELRRNLLLRRNYYFKRVLDYAISVPLFLASLPLLGVLALWVKSVSPGPAFYTQEREGYRRRRIRIRKLRTMFPDAEQLLQSHLERNPDESDYWNRFFKLKRDPRILPGVGQLLRRTSLDELPQLWNVMRGEMSLVGPRPFPVYHMNSFGPDFRELRQSVLPGLTGFWQISERSDGDVVAQERLDTYYIRNWSLWLDLYILAYTIKAVVRPSGAY